MYNASVVLFMLRPSYGPPKAVKLDQVDFIERNFIMSLDKAVFETDGRMTVAFKN